MASVTFVVMAGGSGERLWPLVRMDVPKVCISLDGDKTLLHATLARLRGCVREARLLIVTTAAQVGPIRRTLPRHFSQALLVEPEPKNTAACLTLAAAVVARRDPSTVMVALPADHWIKPVAALHRSWRAGIELAQQTSQLVLVGLPPTHAHPGLGYLELGKEYLRRDGCRSFLLRRFTEKPSRAMAQRLMRQRRTSWNAGMFIGQAGTFLSRIARWLPAHARLIEPLARHVEHPGFVRRAAEAYRRLQPISFDSGVMARQPDGYVVEGRFAWEDLGSWESWARVARTTQAGLAVAGHNVRVVTSQHARHLVATVGLKDLIVVHTRDATLVCRRTDTQAVREVVAQLSRDRSLAPYR